MTDEEDGAGNGENEEILLVGELLLAVDDAVEKGGDGGKAAVSEDQGDDGDKSE